MTPPSICPVFGFSWGDVNKCLFAPDRVPRHTKKIIPSKELLEWSPSTRVKPYLQEHGWLTTNPIIKKATLPWVKSHEKCSLELPSQLAGSSSRESLPSPIVFIAFYSLEEGRCEFCHLLIFQSLFSSSRREWSNWEKAATLPNLALILGLM